MKNLVGQKIRINPAFIKEFVNQGLMKSFPVLWNIISLWEKPSKAGEIVLTGFDEYKAAFHPTSSTLSFKASFVVSDARGIVAISDHIFVDEESYSPLPFTLPIPFFIPFNEEIAQATAPVVFSAAQIKILNTKPGARFCCQCGETLKNPMGNMPQFQYCPTCEK